MEVSMVVFDGIGPALGLRVARSAVAAEAAMEIGAHEMESYAKSNAPWSDRTGAARAGLNASVHESLSEITIVLAHGVDYGYWLEMIEDGEFAILLPTIEALGPKVLEAAGVAALGGL